MFKLPLCFSRLHAALRPWLGSGAGIAVAIFVVGRLGLEPLRPKGQFDDTGLEAFHAVETYKLRKPKTRPEIAFLGSSQTMWGVHTPTVAKTLDTPLKRVHNLGTPGGSAFDMWNMVRRNPRSFRNLKVAVVEVSPFILKTSLENDPRLKFSVSQHATLPERLLLDDTWQRLAQLGEWALPVQSVRRSLRSALLDVIRPEPGLAIYPSADSRIHLPGDWDPKVAQRALVKPRHTVTADEAARRLMRRWKLSKLHDSSLRKLMVWMNARHIPVIVHQVPVSPEVAAIILTEPSYAKTYADFGAYYDSLQPRPVAIYRMLGLDEIGLGAEGMADRTHLNKTGAMAYSGYLAGNMRPLNIATAPQPRRKTNSRVPRKKLVAAGPMLVAPTSTSKERLLPVSGNASR